MDAIDGGAWRFGDASAPSGTRTFFAGTFNKNPLGMAVANAVLMVIEEEGSALQEQLNRRTEAFTEPLNAYFATEGIDISIARFGSLFRFSGQGNMDPFYFTLIANGVYVWEGRSCFLSTAHTDEDLAVAANAVKTAGQAFKELKT
jgi:glutamate-1-semialdehyde aminotransferase